MIVDLVVGARPNFVKAAAIFEAAKKHPQVTLRLIHTGQHTGIMSDPFFKEFELPEPIFLETPRNADRKFRFVNMLAILTEWSSRHRPDYVMVVGDTDSTAAGAIAAVKLSIPLIHVEAGLRSGDRKMPEEINRLLVDSVADLKYTTTDDARRTLLHEGHNPNSVVNVGNVMIDTLFRFLPKSREIKEWIKGPYALVTLHRAGNVDDEKTRNHLWSIVEAMSEFLPVICPGHPRFTSNFTGRLNIPRITYTDPMGYLQFITLMDRAAVVVTDSGGVQEETTALGVPCITLRNSTERPETILAGTNVVVGHSKELALTQFAVALLAPKKDRRCSIPLWDGRAAERLMADLVGDVV